MFDFDFSLCVVSDCDILHQLADDLALARTSKGRKILETTKV